MANEIQFTDATGRNDYVTITNTVGQWWNRNLAPFGAFEDFNASHFNFYDFPAIEFGFSMTYMADMSSAIPAGFYNVVARNRAAGPPPAAASSLDKPVAVGSIVWNGTAVVDDARALDLAEADEVIRTDTTPWTLEYRRKGTSEVLLVKQLKQLDGSNLTGEGVAVGQKVQ